MRVALGLAQVLGVLVVVFVVASVLPGDAAVVIAADDADPARIAQLRETLGLDRPLLTQFGDWLTGLLHGDLGTSAVSGRPVTEILSAALAPTLTLAALALAVLIPLAVLLGVAAAVGRGSRVDRTISGMAVALYAAPEFAVAIVLVAVFAVRLGVFAPPLSERVGPCCGSRSCGCCRSRCW